MPMKCSVCALIGSFIITRRYLDTGCMIAVTDCQPKASLPGAMSSADGRKQHNASAPHPFRQTAQYIAVADSKRKIPAPLA